jgi:hypothetical protein
MLGWRGLLTAVTLATVGCASEARPAEKPEAPRRAPATVVRPSLMPSTQLSCSNLFGDVAMSTSLGLEVTSVHGTERVPGANAVCSIRAAELPTKKEERARERAHHVRAGDELCEVRVFCTAIYDPAAEAQRCTGADQAFSHDVGKATCVRSFRNDRHTVTFLDDDAGCRVEVFEGARIKGVDAALRCAHAAADQLFEQKLADVGSGVATR